MTESGKKKHLVSNLFSTMTEKFKNVQYTNYCSEKMDKGIIKRRCSRPIAAQTSLLNYLVVLILLSIIPFFVFHDCNAILRSEHAFIFHVLYWLFSAIFLPQPWFFRFVMPLVTFSVHMMMTDRTQTIKHSRFCTDTEHYKDISLFLLPTYYGIFVRPLKYTWKLCWVIWCRFIEIFPVWGAIIFFVVCLINSVIISYVLIAAFYNFPSFFGNLVGDGSSISTEYGNFWRNEDICVRPLYSFERSLLYEIQRQNISHAWNVYGYNASGEERSFPICREVFYRVEGEDVEIACNLSPQFYTVYLRDDYNFINKNRFQKWEWKIKEIITNDSYQYFITNENFSYKLRIIGLSTEHFQHEITLWATLRTYSQGTLSLIQVKFGSFFVHYKKDIIQYIHVPQGHIVFMNKLPFYTYSGIEETVVYHNISSLLNDEVKGDTSSICTGNFGGCSPLKYLVYSYGIYSKAVLARMKINSNVLVPTEESGMLAVNSLSCICDRAYGKHEFHVVRTLYNASSKQNFLVEVVLPFKFIILPRGLTNLSSRKYKDLQNEVAENIQENKGQWKIYWKIFNEYENVYYFIIHIIEYIVVIVIHCDIVMIAFIFVKLYCNIVLRRLFRIILVPRSENVIVENVYNVSKMSAIGEFDVNDAIVQDVMIINTEEDYEFSANVLVPFFENLGLSVLLPQTDLTGGQSTINAYSQAVASSRLFVVVGTSDFVHDTWHNKFVLSNLILSRIYELEHHAHHVIIIKWDDIDIPRPLRWNSDITIIHWSEELHERHNLMALRKKVLELPGIT